MSITDGIIKAIYEELDRRRPEIDNDRELRTLSLIVRVDARSLRPKAVLFRKEAQHDLPDRWNKSVDS